MAIQNRRGSYADFDPEKLVPGEFAVVTSGDETTKTGKGIYICYSAGDVQRLSTYDEVVASIDSAIKDSDTLQAKIQSSTEQLMVDHPEWRTQIPDGGVSEAKLADNSVTADKLAEDAIKAILLRAYPVGKLYISADSTSPATLFGGTWERIQDKFLLAAGTHEAGTTGGEETHKLTVDEMPSHNHNSNVRVQWWNSADKQGPAVSWSDKTALGIDAGTTYSSNTGGGKGHNNMPPYLAVYVWKRTA